MKKRFDRTRIWYKANKMKGFHFPKGFTSNIEGIRIDNGNSEIFRKLKGNEGTFNVSDIRELFVKEF